MHCKCVVFRCQRIVSQFQPVVSRCQCVVFRCQPVVDRSQRIVLRCQIVVDAFDFIMKVAKTSPTIYITQLTLSSRW